MPLNANFLADFSSYLDATKQSITATENFEHAADKLGPAVDQSVSQAGAAVDKNSEKLVKIAQGMNLAAIGSQLKTVASDVTSFAQSYIAEFAEAEAATSRLEQALKNSGQASPDVAKAYGDMATELQKISTFSDEAITDAQTLFTAVGNVSPDNMRATLEATMDLAKGMGVDLADAAKLMAKAASSDGDALGKLKLILGDSVPAGADFADVMDAINSKFGGQSAAAMETTAGRMENMKNQMSDINERVGQVFAENLKKLMDVFQSLPEGMQTFILAVVGIGTALAPVLVSLGSLVTLLSGTAIGTGLSTFFAWLMTVIGPAGWLILALVAVYQAWKHWDDITAIVKALYDGVKSWLVDKLGGVFTWLGDKLAQVGSTFKWLYDVVVGHSYVPDMINGIESQFARLDAVMVAPTMKSLNLINDKFVEFSKLGGLGIERNLADAFDVVMKDGMATLVPKLIDQTPWGAAGRMPASESIGRGSISPSAIAAATPGPGAPVTITINMSGMMGTDDPQTRSMLRDAVSDALMSGMRNTRLMGTA